MHRSELDQGTLCADCGARILEGAEDGFGFGESAMLCATCSAPCTGSCPIGVPIREKMLDAHRLLSLPA